MIDYVIDLNNLEKFGFGKISPDGGTLTQLMRFRPFLFSCFLVFLVLNFLRTLMRVKTKRLNRFWRAIRHSTPFGESKSDQFLEMRNIDQWPWPWKGQNPPFCLTLKTLTRIISKTVRDIENVFIEVRYKFVYGLSNCENIFDLSWPVKVEGQTLETLKSNISKTVRDREKVLIEVRYEVMYGLSNGEICFDLWWPSKVKGTR